MSGKRVVVNFEFSGLSNHRRIAFSFMKKIKKEKKIKCHNDAYECDWMEQVKATLCVKCTNDLCPLVKRNEVSSDACEWPKVRTLSRSNDRTFWNSETMTFKKICMQNILDLYLFSILNRERVLNCAKSGAFPGSYSLSKNKRIPVRPQCQKYTCTESLLGPVQYRNS